LHENVPTIRPEIWRQKNWLLHHDKAVTQAALIFFLDDQANLLGEVSICVIIFGVLVYKVILS
jgi:hypothetical protein